jgi:murein DD-endopeptidase MepM/ murein hydrolase activator NlpD
VTFGVVGVLMVSPVHGETSSASLKNQLEDRKQEVQRIKDQIAAIKNQQHQTAQKKEAARRQVEELRGQIAGLNEEIANLNDRISALREKIDDTKRNIKERQNKIEALQKDIDQKKQEVAALVRNLHTDNTLKNEFYALARSKNLSAALDDIADSLELQERMKKKLQKVRDHKTFLENEKQKLAREKSQLNERQKQLEEQRVAKETQKRRSAQAASQEEARMSELERQEHQLSVKEQRLHDRRIDVRRELERIEQQLANQYSNSACQGIHTWPIAGASKTQGYGRTPYAQQSQYYDSHRGIDLGGVPHGAPVKATAPGRVVSVGANNLSYGKWVVIEHDTGMYSLYGHLSRQSVREGQRVARGQVVGGMGDSGLSTAPHLHLSMYAPGSLQVSGSPAGAPINPEGCRWQ